MATDTKDVERLARIAKALSDPIRLKMVGIMAEGRGCCDLSDPQTRNVPGRGVPSGICVCEFQEQFCLGQSRTSYHLRVLKEAVLVTEEMRGKWTFCGLDREALGAALRLLQDLTAANDSYRGEREMTDETKCTKVGCMTPAQVVECADRENTECWYAATMIAEDGSEVTYECCDGGKRARFSLLRKGSAPRAIKQNDVPNSPTWVRRSMV